MSPNLCGGLAIIGCATLALGSQALDWKQFAALAAITVTLAILAIGAKR